MKNEMQTNPTTPMSRPKRWAKALDTLTKINFEEIDEALAEMNDLRSEYEDWQNNLPDSLQSGALADKLQTIIDLDFDDIISSLDDIKSFISDLECIELPQGFGRD
jgi:hypothetical protein